jgi:hypothetical protein
VNYVVRFRIANIPRLAGAIFAAVAGLCFVTTTAAQNSAVNAIVPNGTASNEMLRLTLRDAITMASRYTLGADLGGGTGSVFSLPPENATGNYVNAVRRVSVRIDFERVSGETLNAEGLLKPGLSVEPDVRVR